MCSNGDKSILQQSSKYQQVLHMTSLSGGQSGDWDIKNRHRRWPHCTPLYLIEWQNVYKGLSLSEQLTSSCREKNEMIDVSFISYYSFKISSRWNVYVSDIDLGKTGCDNDPVCCGLAVCACLLLISPCCSEFTRLQLRKDESHQTLMNATLRLLLSWFASPSWHWFQRPQIFHILKHTGTTRERRTNCHNTLTTLLRPPGQPSLNMSWGQIICHRSTLLVASLWGEEKRLMSMSQCQFLVHNSAWQYRIHVSRMLVSLGRKGQGDNISVWQSDR